jgi:hypothetical protein
MDVYTVNLGGQYHDDVSLSRSCWWHGTESFAKVLYNAYSQAGVQEVHQGCRSPLQEQQSRLRVATWYVSGWADLSAMVFLLMLSTHS